MDRLCLGRVHWVRVDRQLLMAQPVVEPVGTLAAEELMLQVRLPVWAHQEDKD